MFWKNPAVVGVSYEEDAIRMSATRGDNLLSWASVELSAGKASDQNARISALTDALSAFIAANSLGKPVVVISPPADDLVVATTMMKKLEGSELQNALTWEVERVTGFTPNSCFWTYSASNHSPVEGELEITIMAMDRMLAERYSSACNKAGATLDSFVPSPWNLVPFNRSSLEYVAFVDLGASTTRVSVIREGVRFHRDIRMGYRSAAEAVSGHQTGKVIEDLFKNGINPEAENSIEIADKIADRISQTFEFAQRQMGIEIARVCLLGKGAGIKGLSAYLTEATHHNVEVLQAAADFKYLNEDKKRLIWENHTSYYNSIGTAQTDKPVIAVGAGGKSESALSLKALGVYAVAAAIVASVAIHANNISLQRDLKSVQKAADQLRPSLQDLENLQNRSNNLMQLRTKSESIINSRIRWSGVLSNLSNNLSQNVWLNRFDSITGRHSDQFDGFSITGYGLDHPAIGESLRQLQEIEAFEDITLGSTSSEIVSGKPVIRFTLTGKLK